MKKKVLFAAMVLMAMSFVTKARAYDFSYTYQGQTLYYNIVDGAAQVTYQQEDYVNGCYANLTGSVTIPGSVTYSGTTYTVTSIGFAAFYKCSNITAVTIPASVTSIDNYAFGWCDGLASVMIPNDVTSIGYAAFAGCNGLSSVVVPIGVDTIGFGAFSGVRHIEYYGNATGSPWGAISMNGVTEGDFVYSDTTRHYLAAYIGAGGAVTIPSTVDTIGERSFSNCAGLTSVSIPASVISIGDYAFSNDSNLAMAPIPTTVSSIGQGAFSHCSSLASVTLPEGLTIINGWAFFHCSSLSSIVIPEAVTVIDTSAFSECFNLTSVTIGSGVVTINDWAFSLCGMASVTIPSSVTRIGCYAFGGTQMQSVTVPESVSFLGSSSFGSTDTVYMLSQTPPSTDTYFTGPTTGIVVVPCGRGALYTNAWNTWGGVGQHIVDPCVQAGTFTLINHGGGYFTYVDYAQYDEYGNHVQVFISDTTVLVSTTPQTQTLLFASFVGEQYGYAPLTRVTYNGTEIDLSNMYSNDYGEYVMYQYNTGLPGVYEAWFGETETYNVVFLSSDESLGEVEGYYDGETATAWAYAYGGSVFNGWSNGSMDNPLTIIVTSDTTLTALFSAGGTATSDTILVHDTTYITLTDTVTNTIFDTITNIFHDTITNTVYDTTVVYSTDTLWLTQTDTIYITLHDTIIVHDTIVVGVDEVEAINAKIYAGNGQLVVEGADGNSVVLYDAVGRRLAVKRDEYSILRFDIPASGAYLVKVGNAPARRIVVVR